MQTESELISKLFSITCHYTRKLRLFVLAILCLTCCGCITGTVAEFCDNCYEKTRIIERTGEFSQDGTTFTVYSKKQIEYISFRLLIPPKNTRIIESILIS